MTARNRLVGILLGLVALGLLLVLAVLLPRVAPGDSGSVTLPDTLPGGLTTIRAAEPPADAGVDAEEFMAEQQKWVDYTEETASKAWEEPVEFDVYVDESYERGYFVTVYGGPGGAFGAPQGLLSGETAEAQGMALPATEMVREGEVVCEVTWPQIPADQEVAEDTRPARVVCQQPAGERTVQVAAADTTVGEAADVLADVIAGI